MSKTNIINMLDNPNPLKGVRRGQIICAYDPDSNTIVEGTVESTLNTSIIIRTETGIHTYWLKELWDDKSAAEKELDLRLHPVRERLISELDTVQKLLAFCIDNDFTGKGAADMRQAVSARALELLGIDPFAREAADSSKSDDKGVA